MHQLSSFLKVVCAILLPLISMVRAGILPTNQRTLYEIFGSGIDTDDNLRTKGFDEVSRLALILKWFSILNSYINALNVIKCNVILFSLYAITNGHMG